MVLRTHRRVPILNLVKRLRCKTCGANAMPIYLSALPHRTFQCGPEAGWAIELIPPPKGLLPMACDWAYSTRVFQINVKLVIVMDGEYFITTS